MDELLGRFEWRLEAQGYLAMLGQIADSSLVPAPKQCTRND